MNALLLGNPKRRRRKAGARRRHRRGARKMSAKQLKYFGPRKRRSSARRARRSAVTVYAPNPSRRRRSRRRSLGTIRRRFRRNPISASGIRASVGGITGVLGRAAVGAGGAVAVDMLMAQASRFMPASVSSRYTAEGKMNPMYYGAKLALTIGVGLAGARFAPGRMRGIVARGVEGALTVQGYDMLRSLLPPSMLGFYNPGRVANGGMAGMRGRVGRMGAYLPAGGRLARLGSSMGAGSAFSGASVNRSDARVGEGPLI